MAITLSPAPSTLGILAPVLGPWFSTTSVTLPVPDLSKKLALALSASGADFLPPATGTLSLFVSSTGNPPGPIAHLQNADGAYPFGDNQLVAYFRLLPEVEARLHELMRLMPSVTAQNVTAPPTTLAAAATRPRVRAFALVPQLGSLTAASVLGLVDGAGDLTGSDAQKMTALGLALSGSTVQNGTLPMTWLRRPGKFSAPGGVIGTQQDKVLTSLPAQCDLWAFDARGRAIDAGAVAAWWSWLLTDAVGAPGGSGTAFQLLPTGINATDLPTKGSRRVVCNFTDARTAHFVDAHEGPLLAPLLNSRLQAGGSAVSSNLRSVTSSLALSFSAAPSPGTPAPPVDNPPVDSAPRPRVAVLPDGSYGSTVTVWPGGGAILAGLERDFARIAAVDEEFHLVGVRRRDSRIAPGNPGDRRASSQNRPSTRTNVARTTGTAAVLQATADLAHGALLGVFNTVANTRAVLGVADVQAGGTLEGLHTMAAGAPALPATLPEGNADAASASYRVRALVGGGDASSDRQEVLVEISLGAAGHAGTWVRCWPLGFDFRTGLHFRLSGGGGRADSNGVARLALTLANGKVEANALMGMDVQVSRLDSNGNLEQRSYADRRFQRPVPVAGTPTDPSTFSGSTSWVIAETGQTGTGALPAGTVPAGATIIVTGSAPAAVDRTKIPATALVSSATAGVLAGKVRSGDIVSLTQPAYKATPDRADPLGRPVPRQNPSSDGNPNGGFDGISGLVLHRLDRGLVSSSTASSVPLALQDRLEVVASSVSTGGTPTATAALGAASPLPYVHEQAPGHLGHPGARAAIEVHGTGVALDGAPAVAVAEYTRERTAGLTYGFVQSAAEPLRSAAVQSELAVAAEASTALPTIAEGTSAGPVVAVLRTGPVGQEGIFGVATAATQVALPGTGQPVFPTSANVGDALVSWLNGVNLPGGAGSLGNQLRSLVGTQIDSITRALDRRLQVGAFGARETAVALAAAFARAQDLVYIETPAVDALAHGPVDDTLNLWQTLIDRMGTRRGLQVVLCVPTLLAPGTPRTLQGIRDYLLLDAITRMRDAAPDRFAVFSPGAGAGRAVRFASTSVIVDDALAITGTSHLWRRGLTYDSSLAAAVFDERLVDGRPQEVRAFRLQLLADRLGLPVARVPDDPADLARAVRDFDQRGSVRLSATAIRPPDDAPSTTDQNAWNPDGTRTDLDPSVFEAMVAQTDVDHAIVEG